MGNIRIYMGMWPRVYGYGIWLTPWTCVWSVLVGDDLHCTDAGIQLNDLVTLHIHITSIQSAFSLDYVRCSQHWAWIRNADTSVMTDTCECNHTPVHIPVPVYTCICTCKVYYYLPCPGHVIVTHTVHCHLSTWVRGYYGNTHCVVITGCGVVDTWVGTFGGECLISTRDCGLPG